MDPVSAIARAVLYEGYLLWPYRKSALKNRQRWTIGSIVPQEFSQANGDTESWHAQAECLLETPGAAATVSVTVRFLHLVDRRVLADGEPLDHVRVAGRLYLSWEEAAEREVLIAPAPLEGLRTTLRLPFTVPAGRRDEPVRAATGEPVTLLRRTWQRLDGVIELAADRVKSQVWRLTVRLLDTTPCPSSERAQAMRRSLVSAHVVLRVHGGQFISALDPPPALHADVSRCTNRGLWPVLVGEQGDRTRMLAAPIVLYDWPQVAPESPGDLFDATEIDQMLIMNVLSMTAQEQEEMAATDPHAREILQRCAGLSHEELLTLHGALRDVTRETW